MKIETHEFEGFLIKVEKWTPKGCNEINEITVSKDHISSDIVDAESDGRLTDSSGEFVVIPESVMEHIEEIVLQANENGWL